MEDKNNEPEWRSRLENMFASTGGKVEKEAKEEKYNFEVEAGDDIYTFEGVISGTKRPKDKPVELKGLVGTVGGLSSFRRSKTGKVKRVSELVRELAEDHVYTLERKVGQDHHVYTRRIGEECDVLIEACGKIIYTHMNLKLPGRHDPFYGNIYKVLSQNKEVKKLGKSFWAVEEGCFIGTYAQRLFSYAAATGMTTVAGIAFGFYQGAYFLTVNMPLFGAIGLLSSLAGVGVTHALYKRKMRNTIKEHSPNLIYNEKALEKAFAFKPHPGLVKTLAV